MAAVSPGGGLLGVVSWLRWSLLLELLGLVLGVPRPESGVGDPSGGEMTWAYLLAEGRFWLLSAAGPFGGGRLQLLEVL